MVWRKERGEEEEGEKEKQGVQSTAFYKALTVLFLYMLYTTYNVELY